MSLVRQLELKTNINLRFFEVDCWPIVRNSFMALVSHGHLKRDKKNTMLSYVKAFLDFIFLLSRPVTADAIVLTDYKQKVQIQGNFYFKDAYVIKKLLSKSNKKCHIFTQSSPNSLSRDLQLTSVLFISMLSAIFSKLLMMFDFSKVIPDYLEYIYNSSELKSLIKSQKNSKKQVKKNIYFVIVASFLFELLLKRIQPKKCYIVCYYSCLGMALCVACRRLGIESIDLQHGVSGSNMRAYGQWNKMPVDGLNTLPKSFFCWSSLDLAAINKWAIGNKYHRAFLSGNIWDTYQKKNNSTVLPEELYLRNEVKGFRKILLYTARNHELPRQILALLENAPSDYFFMFRIHPDTKNVDIKTLSSKIKKINSSYSILNPTKSRIHKVLELTDIHITEWSAVVYDADFMQVPSIVISEIGKDYFEDFINRRNVFYCADLPSLMKKIESASYKEISEDNSCSLPSLNSLL